MAKQCTELLGRYLELSAKKSLKPFILSRHGCSKRKSNKDTEMHQQRAGIKIIGSKIISVITTSLLEFCPVLSSTQVSWFYCREGAR